MPGTRPPDSFILTLGCGKYRIREHDYGEHLGLPRLMDMGQCNDAYGAIAWPSRWPRPSTAASTTCR
jgi:hypothetical protein